MVLYRDRNSHQQVGNTEIRQVRKKLLQQQTRLVEDLLQLSSSEWSMQSGMPSHCLHDGIHWLLLHRNSPAMQTTKQPSTSYYLRSKHKNKGRKLWKCFTLYRYYPMIKCSHMHHLTFGINSLLHSVNLIVFTLLLAHLILRISPHHSHHLRSHHLSLSRPFTPDLKLISFTNPFLHSHSYSFRTDFTVLNLYCIKGALALFVLVSFSGHVC